jgi:hypothetical protein
MTLRKRPHPEEAARGGRLEGRSVLIQGAFSVGSVSSVVATARLSVDGPKGKRE